MCGHTRGTHKTSTRGRVRRSPADDEGRRLRTEPRTLRAQRNRSVIDAMPGRQMERDAIEELGCVYLDELGQAGFHNRHDAIGIDACHRCADWSSHTSL